MHQCTVTVISKSQIHSNTADSAKQHIVSCRTHLYWHCVAFWRNCLAFFCPVCSPMTAATGLPSRFVVVSCVISSGLSARPKQRRGVLQQHNICNSCNHCQSPSCLSKLLLKCPFRVRACSCLQPPIPAQTTCNHIGLIHIQFIAGAFYAKLL